MVIQRCLLVIVALAAMGGKAIDSSNLVLGSKVTVNGILAS